MTSTEEEAGTKRKRESEANHDTTPVKSFKADSNEVLDGALDGKSSQISNGKSNRLLEMSDKTAAVAPGDMSKIAPIESHYRESEEMRKLGNLEALQTPHHQKLLDAIDEIRNCGLDKELSLPQLIVCGDQSAGKSSVLEALTEINFPRADNLCTRFATEIVLRRDANDHLSVKIIPDGERPDAEFQKIKAWSASISDFSMLSLELPGIIDDAKSAMGIGESTRTFASDILSIEIRGPTRPQLTVVDLPGIIQNEIQSGDKAMVDRLTKQYISQPRTICLAVITAMNDADNQRILTFVKEEDPEGFRSLGIVTKPDTLPPGSGNERSFINLAANKHNKYFFKLGWHVLKNRKFEEAKASFQERNRLEAEFFQSSNFKELARDSLGIVTLQVRLSQILFEHVKRELPGMRSDVESMISSTTNRLKNLGPSRLTPTDCREYLMQLSQEMYHTGRSAISGIYDTEFLSSGGNLYLSSSKINNRRLRARIQEKNERFASVMRKSGHTFHFGMEKGNEEVDTSVTSQDWLSNGTEEFNLPQRISYGSALSWVGKMITENRGRELQGNYNPLVISQMFWFQSKRWKSITIGHINDVTKLCRNFVHDLLGSYCTPDVCNRVWAEHLEEIFKSRKCEAEKYLDEIMALHYDHPINHNHYYTETVQKVRSKRMEQRLKELLQASAAQAPQAVFGSTDKQAKTISADVVANVANAFCPATEKDQQKFCCEEALDCLRAIYKVKQKVFIDNVVTLIIEGRVVRGLENVFSPKMVNRMNDEEVDRLASEPDFTKRERIHCQQQLERLKSGQDILKNVLNLSEI